MLSEGTRIKREGNISEESIEKTASEIINQTRGHVVVNYPIRDLDRFLTFYNVAKNTDRIMVISLKQAYILHLFESKGYPSIDELAIYIPRRKWGMISDESYACVEGEWICSSDLHQQHINEDYYMWERPFLTLDNTVNYQNIHQEPAEYLFSCDFFEFKELIDVKPNGGIYLYSKTEPFNEEIQIDFDKVKNWVNHFDLTLVSESMHGSGHANRQKIMDMITS